MRFTAALRRNRMSHAVVAPTGRPYSFPSPTGGWNSRDPLESMKPQDAIVLDNYFPTTGNVQLRGGSTPVATGMGAGIPVETLEEWAEGTTNEMWAWANNKIYDVTTVGAVGAPAVSGLSNSRWQCTNFTSVNSTRLICVNGVDDMLQYDGTTWASINSGSAPIAITGVNTNKLVNVWVYQERLFFIEKDTMNAWCLDVKVFGGAAHKIDLGGLFGDGGCLIAGGTWTRDGGNGMDDLCVFITNKGEIAIFSGNDPTDAAHWSKIGQYQQGTPIGYRCLVKTGADLALMTLDGIVGLSTIISLDRAASNRVALSSKISGAFAQVTQQYGSNFGWQAISYPRANQAWFNIPIQEGVQQQQYVLNTITGSWCRFKDLNANVWCLHNNRLYFGNNNGEVWLADEGDTDDGVAISGLVKTSFQSVGNPAFKKKFNLIRPRIVSNIDLVFGAAIVVDYDISDVSPQPSSPSFSGLSAWNIATWDVDPWDTLVLLKRWIKVKGKGNCVAIIFATNTAGFSVQLNSIDLLFEPAGIL